MVNFGSVLQYLALNPQQTLSGDQLNSSAALTTYTLPQLPYAYDVRLPPPNLHSPFPANKQSRHSNPTSQLRL